MYLESFVSAPWMLDTKKLKLSTVSRKSAAILRNVPQYRITNYFSTNFC